MFIGWSTEVLGDQIFLPGTGLMAGAYVQIIGAETLKQGTPIHLGWIPVFAVSLLHRLPRLAAIAIRSINP